MADRPILFSSPMVRAILEGRKTQTRRVLRVPAPFEPSDEISVQVATGSIEPQFRHRDRLWVRETWQGLSFGDYQPTKSRVCDLRYRATDPLANSEKEVRGYPWRPGIHMPRWASRLTLIVTDVRVQRLQDISEADAWEEGCVRGDPDHVGGFFPAEEPDPSGIGHRGWDNARDWFADLWDSLNAKRGFGWEANPWVCAVTFTAHQCNIDQMEAA